jgi:hypothetical protein
VVRGPASHRPSHDGRPGLLPKLRRQQLACPADVSCRVLWVNCLIPLSKRDRNCSGGAYLRGGEEWNGHSPRGETISYNTVRRKLKRMVSGFRLWKP